MLRNPDYVTARRLLLDAVEPVGREFCALERCGGRLLGRNLTAAENIPPFDRSPYDGYALRAADTAGASREVPVTLRVLEEVAAGAVPSVGVTPGTAVKVLTGAPIPAGADAVINYERTTFTPETVTLFAPLRAGANIVRTGEDVRAGTLLARAGDKIDPGTAGALAAQGVTLPEVYRVSRIGLISTGDELVEAGGTPGPGQIRNSNRHTLEAALAMLNCRCIYLGTARDTAEAILGLRQRGLAECDGVLLTGGVSAGDYDRTPDAMELAGVEMLFRGVDMKPGMACAYGVFQGKPVCGLSGNPASAFTNFCVLALPALRRRMGYRQPLPPRIRVALSRDFPKKSPSPRFLRGTLDLTDGAARLVLPEDQGNVVLRSTIGCNVLAEVPAGSGPLASGTVLEGFML